MKLSTTVEVVTTFDLDKTPDSILAAMSMYSEEQLKDILRQTFIGAITEVGALDEINARGSYAIVSFA